MIGSSDRDGLEIIKMEKQYTIDWFKKRAIEFIKPIGPGVWDFSDSSLLYVNPAAVEAYEEIQKEGDLYHDLITIPETKYISRIADRLASELPQEFNYIDLGPGTERKEGFFFDALKKLGKNFAYFPVDISPHILNTAKEFAENQGIKVIPIHASFEECVDQLPANGIYRFVSLGLTFVNYHIQDGLELLSKIIDSRGSAFINSHIQERANMAKVRELYVAQLNSIIAPKIKLLDLSQEDISDIEVNDRVEVWCMIKNPTPALIERGIKDGDRFLVFQSLRHGLDYLKNQIPKVFPNYSIFDTGLSFVGFLLKKP